MSRAPSPSLGFVGELSDIEFIWGDRTMIVCARLPLQDFNGVSRSIGVPAEGEEAPGPAVMLLACRPPQHPERDPDMMADAVLAALEQLVAGGELRISPDLSRRLGALADAVSIRVVREAVSDKIQEPA